MAKLVPVEHDPFAPSSSKLTPIDNNPFEPSDLNPTPEPDNSWSGFGREVLRSAGEGIAGALDLPEQIVTGVRNLPRRLANAGVTYGGESFTGDASPPSAPVELLNPENIYTTAYNKAFPVTPGYENSWTREAGNIVGPTALTLGVGSVPAIVEGVAARSLPAVAKTVAKVVGDTALTTTGTVAGTEGGGLAGQYVAGDEGRQWGRALGSLAGGFTTPIARGSFESALRKKLLDSQSAQRAADAERAGVQRDISLVGSDTGVTAAKQAPGYAEVRKTQQDQIDESLREAARARANRGQGPTMPISEPDVGRSAADLAAQSRETAYQAGDKLFDPMSVAAGRNTPVDDSIVQRTLDNLRQTRSAVAQPTIDYYQNLLDAERAKGGLTWDAALEHRTLARPADNALSFDAKTHDAIVAAYTEALRNRAGQVGYSPQEFDTINARYGELKKQQDTLHGIGEKKAVPAYEEVFGPENAGGENLRLLQEHGDPNSLANLLASNFELKTRGSAAGRLSRLPDAKLYPGGPKWWADASEEMRQAYANNPELRDQIDATMNIIRADARRGGAPVPVSSDSTLGIVGGATALGGFGAGAATLVPKAAAYAARRYYGGKLLDPTFTENLVQGQTGPILTPKDLARAMAASVGAQQSNAR